MAIGDQTNYFVHTLLRARDWQHRPQFDQVCDWWRGGGRGVCALVGMGGAGKTAIAERFLRTLPGGLPEDLDVGKDESLPRPHSTFVFSFYDAPNPEAFFEALQMWLERTPRVETVLSVGQLLFLLQQTSGLMLLDGLEKVQDDGARGVFGRLSSPKLRDFLDHLAAGYVSHLGVLVTSRFPLADLRDAHPQFFRKVPVDQIDVATGIHLLRDRGVHGSDLQLKPVVEECGRHALTVDFAGGYIKEYGKSDPATRLNLGTAEELQAAVEQEPDDDRRAVLKQGYRFARIAERYREAMLKSDEAALALLERICLFRLGVECETLAAIFTGPDAAKVSGKALAVLDAKQLKEKLDWLVRMRIVEQSESSSALTTDDSKLRTVYSIHPAVRDGFLNGIGREAAEASHEAVRHGLEVSLGEAPGQNPSDPATLDLLGEIVHHTIQSGHVPEAWDIYWNRIGGFKNLDWRLGAFERGDRICRQFAGGTPSTAKLSSQLSEQNQADLLRGWALYATELGQLGLAKECYLRELQLRTSQENWAFAAGCNWFLVLLYMVEGRLYLAHAASQSAIELARRSNDDEAKKFAFASRAAVCSLIGDVGQSSADFSSALFWRNRHSGEGEVLFTWPGIRNARQLFLLGRLTEASRLSKENKKFLSDSTGQDDSEIPFCDVQLADIATENGDPTNARDLLKEPDDWARARDAKEVLCWSALVQARIEFSVVSEQSSVDSSHLAVDEFETRQAVRCAGDAITDGLKIARDCGFGLFHIDLLLERARLHLLGGKPQSALDDIELALDDGIPINDETGQPELLAANHEECGYAWAIPAGLHLRGEAQLLAAAQQLDSDSFVPAKRDELLGEVQTLIESAKSNLNEALAKWQPLHDPEPEREDQNFKHPETGEEHNFRAAETWQILQDLAGGILTKYPLQITVESESIAPPVKQQEPTVMSNRFHVALSFPGEHRSFVLDVAEALADKLTRSRVFYDEWYEVELLGTGGDLKLQSMYMQADLVVPFFSEHYSKPWCSMEWETIRGVLLDRRKDDAVIPVHLDDTEIPGWSAVNFGIRLRGRSAQQIAEVILQALEIRNAGDSATVTASPTSAGTPAPGRSPATPAASVSKTSTPHASGALAIWRERLDYLQQQEAIVSDPGQKFALKKQIEESKQKIKELGG